MTGASAGGDRPSAPEVVLVDYGAGNVRSLRAALERAGARPVVSDEPGVVERARLLMVPGQGAAGPAMDTLRRRGLAAAVQRAVGEGGRLLGVCVGLQLLFEGSEENDAECFGFLPGRVRRLEGVERLPHMGWNDVEPTGFRHPLAPAGPSIAYFAHSYAAPVDAASTAAVTEVDGARFASVVAGDGVVGAQFHPERSADAGLALLRRFLAWADAA